ncbi:hypothetical protein [Paraburkholderia sp. RL18-085-BIA-A]|uniref:hypothetical protein n=1 Tax=Paraburkholderia sp. RL18-085-BIA-A TaxID=3031633 RepID=UPI0038BB276E
MKNDLLIQLKSFQTMAILFWSKRLNAILSFAVVFAGQHLLAAGSLLGDKANERLVSYEMSAPKVGWGLLVALAAIFFLLVARTLVERKAGSAWEWVARGLRSWMAERALSKVASLAVVLFGACAGFGVTGFEFGVLFLLWIYLIVSFVHALVMFADMPAR